MGRVLENTVLTWWKVVYYWRFSLNHFELGQFSVKFSIVNASRLLMCCTLNSEPVTHAMFLDSLAASWLCPPAVVMLALESHTENGSTLH